MKTLSIVSAHAEGEVGNVIVGGAPLPPGDTLWQMRDFLHRDQTLRNIVLNEPRGGVFVHTNLLVPAIDKRASIGFLTMEPMHTPPMSGSNAMCVAMVCLETGLVEMNEPVSEFFLEAAAGLVHVTAQCKNGKVLSVEIENVASFADKINVPVEVVGLATLHVDTAFGGDSFVMVPARALGLSLNPDEGRDIAKIGAKITKAANEQIGFSHPVEDWNQISFCQITGDTTRQADTVTGKNAVVIDPGKIDRSPCGTGCSARMAVLSAKGGLKTGDTFVGRSIIGGRFDCQIKATTLVAGRPAIIPLIKGRAWRTGEHKVFVDLSDPWPQGYRVADTWPGAC